MTDEQIDRLFENAYKQGYEYGLRRGEQIAADMASDHHVKMWRNISKAIEEEKCKSQ